MKLIKDANFRELYRRFVYIEDDELIKRLSSCNDDIKRRLNYDGMLCFGYIDYTSGLTLEVLSGASMDKDGINIGDRIDETRLSIRIGGFSDNCVFEDVSCKELLDMHSDYIRKLLEIYEKDNDAVAIREVEELDPYRNQDYPDDVQVYLYIKGKKAEIVWVRLYGLGDDEITGILLNEPGQDFGVHKCDIIGFSECNVENGKILLSSLKVYGNYKREI